MEEGGNARVTYYCDPAGKRGTLGNRWEAGWVPVVPGRLKSGPKPKGGAAAAIMCMVPPELHALRSAELLWKRQYSEVRSGWKCEGMVR